MPLLNTVVSTAQPLAFGGFAAAFNNKPNIATIVVALPLGATSATVGFAQFVGSQNVLLDSNGNPIPESQLETEGAQVQTLTGQGGDILTFEFAVTNDEPVEYGALVFTA